MKSKKNRFWSFCLSFLPGCAEMYMGFMKMGLSLMVLFWGIVAVAVLLNIGPLLFVEVIVWFYSFFHARNIVHLSDYDFETLEDDYLFHLSAVENMGLRMQQGERKIVALILIALGGVLCLRSFMGALFEFLPSFAWKIYDLFAQYVPQAVVGLGIIALGLWMIRGKQMELLDDQEWEADEKEGDEGHDGE